MKWTVLLLAVLMGGCIEESAQPVDDIPVEEPLPALFGLVLDEQGQRLAGATVRFAELNREQTTDANGSFAFDVPPGQYHLRAELAGHRPAESAITVVADWSAHVVFTLPSWASIPADVVVLEHRGFLECSMDSQMVGPHCPGSNGGTDAFASRLDFSADPVREVILEVFWEPVTASNDVLLISVRSDDGRLMAQAIGTSPLRLTFDEETLDGTTALQGTVRAHAGEGNAGFAVAQTFQAFTSVFLNQPAEANYSIRSAE